MGESAESVDKFADHRWYTKDAQVLEALLIEQTSGFNMSVLLKNAGKKL